jgi:LPXTG-motif cell wall-anchored protein
VSELSDTVLPSTGSGTVDTLLALGACMILVGFAIRRFTRT